MTNYNAGALSTRRAPDWRDAAVCRADADAMHPDNNQAGIAHARSICDMCHVTTACLVDAIRTGDQEWGIRGGLKPEERRKVAKRLTPAQLADPAAVKNAIHHVLHPVTAARTLRDLWDERTRVLPDGHLGWDGKVNTNYSFQGRSYTPKQIAFLIDRGHPPAGIVRRTCEVERCVHPRHIADNVERYLAREAAEQRTATEQEREAIAS